MLLIYVIRETEIGPLTLAARHVRLAYAVSLPRLRFAISDVFLCTAPFAVYSRQFRALKSLSSVLISLLTRTQPALKHLKTMMLEPPWEAKAAAKKASTLDKIPREWRLNEADLENASKQRDLTGPFIQQYLNPDELEIVRQDATALVNKLKKGEYTAKRVTVAFCKAAAIAHQIVR